MSYAVATPSADHFRQPRTRRLGVVATAAIITSLAWLAGHLAGVDYLVVTPLSARPITLGLVAAGTAAAGSAGWALLVFLERHTRRARVIWTALALAVLTSSLVPIFVFPADAPTRVTLGVLHCLAAAILIPGLRHAGLRHTR
ncbi:MAG: hypothetical protein JO296_13545 [Pseudonocardiales bacterium]|nr:hypothetical protein [Pseudonocardiales bacterium]